MDPLDPFDRPRYQISPLADLHFKSFAWILVLVGCGLALVVWGDDFRSYLSSLQVDY